MARLPDPHEIYVTLDPAENEPRARKHALVMETKRAIADIALLDVELVDKADLDELVADMRVIADRLEALLLVGSGRESNERGSAAEPGREPSRPAHLFDGAPGPASRATTHPLRHRLPTLTAREGGLGLPHDVAR